MKIDDLKKLDYYDLFRIRDGLDSLKTYGLADENLLAEVNRVLEEKDPDDV